MRACVGVPDVLCHILGLCGFVFLWLWLLCGGLGCDMFWGLPRGIRQLCERFIYVVVLSHLYDVLGWGSVGRFSGLPTGFPFVGVGCCPLPSFLSLFWVSGSTLVFFTARCSRRLWGSAGPSGVS